MIIMISSIICWLVVWNTAFIFPFSWEFHHPNWSEVMFFRGGGSTTKQFGYDSHDSPQPMDRSRGIHFRNGDSTAESGCHRRNLGGTIFGLLGVWVNTFQNRCFMGYHPGIFSSVILIIMDIIIDIII